MVQVCIGDDKKCIIAWSLQYNGMMRGVTHCMFIQAGMFPPHPPRLTTHKSSKMDRRRGRCLATAWRQEFHVVKSKCQAGREADEKGRDWLSGRVKMSVACLLWSWRASTLVITAKTFDMYNTKRISGKTCKELMNELWSRFLLSTSQLLNY